MLESAGWPLCTHFVSSGEKRGPSSAQQDQDHLLIGDLKSPEGSQYYALSKWKSLNLGIHI